MVEISTLEFIKMQNFAQKQKFLNLDQKGHFIVFYEKANVIFEISILEFVKMQSFVQNQKSVTLVPKNDRFSCFQAAILKKSYCHI